MAVLRDVLVLELGGLAPVPYAGLILADWGAQVVKIERAGLLPQDRLTRGKLSLSIDLRSETGRAQFRALAAKADVLLDPYRPGVLERLGCGPTELYALNPRLIIARLTGYGQSGPLAHAAGHDINYLAVSGVLSLFGRADGSAPIPPVNLLADFAGGGMTCVLGILLALIERNRSGKGQVIDAAMVDGVAYLASFVAVTRSALWTEARGHNLIDTGAPFYETYATSDADQFVAVGCLEPQFFAKFLVALGLPSEERTALQAAQMDRDAWQAMRRRFSEVIKSKSAAHWNAKFSAEPDACATLVSPFFATADRPAHPHMKARGVVVTDNGIKPAPRLLRTPALERSIAEAQKATRALLVSRGAISAEALAKLEAGDEGRAAAL